ncbi:MAG TPA: VOC family protein [Polyangiaceae bacterium]|nr:VOC family protein [Polyangiaceae bacterium]
MTARPFRVLGLQQVALGAPRLEPLVRLWVELLGVPLGGSFTSERENVDERIGRLGAGPFAVELDLMRPLDPEKSPKVHQPPLNHIGLWVDDLAAAHAWLAERGVRFTPGGVRRGAAGHDVCFIHPKGDGASPQGGEGVLIELVQAPPELVRAFDAASGPAGPGAGPGAGAPLP